MKKKIKKILSYSPYGIYEVFRDWKKEKRKRKIQKALIDNYIKSNNLKKIQIGCGSNILEGWLNTDVNYNDRVAFLDAGSKFPIASDTFDCIYSEHLFEHLNFKQQLNMLLEGYRILKKGGVMRIATPTLEFLNDIYINPHTEENTHYVNFYINSFPQFKDVKVSIIDKEEHYNYVINNFFKAWGHQMIHNFSSISKLALQCNYSKVRKCEVGESGIPFLRHIEKHGTIIPERINLKETMVVEIIK